MCSVARGSHRRRKCAQRRHIGVELRRRALRQLADGDAFLGRARVDLVVHVGDVANIGDVIGPINSAQKPEEHVEDDHGPGVADMREIVHGRAAYIHAHGLRIERLERFFASRAGVVKL